MFMQDHRMGLRHSLLETLLTCLWYGAFQALSSWNKGYLLIYSKRFRSGAQGGGRRLTVGENQTTKSFFLNFNKYRDKYP